jgi:hypothetical protein
MRQEKSSSHLVAAAGPAACVLLWPLTFLGDVVDVDFVISHRQSKFIAIDEQPDDDIVHLDGS